jgi:hypothetical protein
VCLLTLATTDTKFLLLLLPQPLALPQMEELLIPLSNVPHKDSVSLESIRRELHALLHTQEGPSSETMRPRLVTHSTP